VTLKKGRLESLMGATQVAWGRQPELFDRTRWALAEHLVAEDLFRPVFLAVSPGASASRWATPLPWDATRT